MQENAYACILTMTHAVGGRPRDMLHYFRHSLSLALPTTSQILLRSKSGYKDFAGYGIFFIQIS